MTSAESPSFPIQYGKYELLERIGEGGMAEVFRARLPGAAGFEKILVVKRILPHLAKKPDFVRMFVDEAKLAAKVQHQNVVQVFELGEAEGGELYMAMEYVSGVDLRRLLVNARERRLRIPVWFVLHTMAEVLNGLTYAHELVDAEGRPLHVVHRDVTPGNIFISYQGEVKLADFGIAKAVGRVSETEAGQVKGNAPFMAPEAIYGRTLDARADVFSAGVVLWASLALRLPFEGSSNYETAKLVCEAKREPPSKYNPLVQPELDQVALQALEIDRARRIPSAREFQARLLELLARMRPKLLPSDVRHVVDVLTGRKSPDAQFSDQRPATATLRRDGEREEIIDVRLATPVWGAPNKTNALDGGATQPMTQPPEPPVRRTTASYDLPPSAKDLAGDLSLPAPSHGGRATQPSGAWSPGGVAPPQGAPIPSMTRGTPPPLTAPSPQGAWPQPGALGSPPGPLGPPAPLAPMGAPGSMIPPPSLQGAQSVPSAPLTSGPHAQHLAHPGAPQLQAPLQPQLQAPLQGHGAPLQPALQAPPHPGAGWGHPPPSGSVSGIPALPRAAYARDPQLVGMPPQPLGALTPPGGLSYDPQLGVQTVISPALAQGLPQPPPLAAPPQGGPGPEIVRDFPLASMMEFMSDPGGPVVELQRDVEKIYNDSNKFLVRFSDGSVMTAKGFDECLSLCDPWGRRAVALSIDNIAWMELPLFARLCGLDYLAPDQSPLKSVAFVGQLEERGLSSVFVQLARARATGRLVIMDKGVHRVARREVDVLNGAPVYVYADHPSLQFPQLFVQHRLVKKELVPDLVIQVLKQRLPIEEVARRNAFVDLNPYRPVFMRDRLAELFTWRFGRFAFDVGREVKGAQPFAPSLVRVLPDAVQRGFSVEELMRDLDAHLNVKLRRADNFDAALGELALKDKQSAAARRLGQRSTIASVLKKYPTENHVLLAMSRILLDLELLLPA